MAPQIPHHLPEPIKKAAMALTHGLHTNPVHHWWYQLSIAPFINGPFFPKSNEKRTRATAKKDSQTAKIHVPVALVLHDLEQLCWPKGFHLQHFIDRHKNVFDQPVGAIPDHPTKMNSEGDVISNSTPSYKQVLEHFMPLILEDLKIPGKVEFPSEFTVYDNVTGKPVKADAKAGSRPDFVMTLDDTIVAAFDYKGTDCIDYKGELHKASASDLSEGKKLVQTMPLAKQDKESSEASNALETGLVKKPHSLLQQKDMASARVLVQQMMKYADETKQPYVLSYDYDSLLLLEVPLGRQESDFVIHSYLAQEKDKSKDGEFKWSDENHVNVTLRYLVRAVQHHLGSTKGGSAK